MIRGKKVRPFPILFFRGGDREKHSSLETYRRCAQSGKSDSARCSKLLVIDLIEESLMKRTSNLLHLALSDFPLCAQRRYVSRDECFSLSPPRKRRMGKRVTFLPRIIFGGQGKSRRPFLDLQQVKSAT